jgi:hypothetical protein
MTYLEGIHGRDERIIALPGARLLESPGSFRRCVPMNTGIGVLAMKSSCPRLADLSLCIVEGLLGTLE